jgi:hypothetical protein
VTTRPPARSWVILWACSACNVRPPESTNPSDESGGAGPVSAASGAPALPSMSAVSDAPMGAGGTPGSDGGSAGSTGMARDEPPLPERMPTEDRAGPGIVTVERGLWMDGKPFLMAGVCWNPVAAGDSHPEGLDFAGFAARDVSLMAALGVNVVRTYEPLLDLNVLDQLWQAGIYVVNAIYPSGAAPPTTALDHVRALADHPAILMWSLGNEWNYNGLYAGLSHDDSIERLNEVAGLIKAEDPRHPVATIYGELPSEATILALPNVDVWGINAYRGLGFGSLFDDWRARSEKPMFLSEYGADAYNADIPAYDPTSQALAVSSLTEELFANAAALHDPGVTLGGTVFEFVDEWWKDPTGSLSVHDVGGNAPGGGPFPDRVFNEEWWGLVDIERAPRPAYESLRQVFLTGQGSLD